jgi:hypothetical protein
MGVLHTRASVAAQSLASHPNLQRHATFVKARLRSETVKLVGRIVKHSGARSNAHISACPHMFMLVVLLAK